MRDVGITVILLAVLLVPAQAQTVRVVAVADFVDDSAQGQAIGASQLNTVLAGLISQRGAGRITVADTAAVRIPVTRCASIKASSTPVSGEKSSMVAG